MSTVPRVNFSSSPTPVGRDGKQSIIAYSIDALLVSQGHWRLPNGSWSGGGPFYCTHDRLQDEGDGVQYAYTDGGSNVNWPFAGVVGVPRPVPSSKVADINYRHGSYDLRSSPIGEDGVRFAEGWRKTRPGNPTAGLGQFLIELRDFPQIIGSNFHGVTWKRAYRKFFKGVPFQQIPLAAKGRVKWFRSLGNEYLNYKFGWQPFVRDLQDIYRTMKNIDRQMAQLVRDNGRGVRRACSLGSSQDTTSSQATFGFPFGDVYGAPPVYGSGRTEKSITTTTTSESWYVAQYSYFIPDTSSWQWNARARAALFGVLPTPELLWEVLPWSWLVDWFSNVGDVVSNASPNAVDNLVARYAYAMTKKSRRQVGVCNITHNGFDALGVKVRRGNWTVKSVRTTESKIRVSGSPYGLGVSYGSLSGGQKAILAALGMSRSNF